MRYLKIELKKGLQSKSFIIVLLVATAITFISFYFEYNKFNELAEYLVTVTSYDGAMYDLQITSLYNSWIGREWASVGPTLFYLLLPLFACISYGWSYNKELRTGYVKNVLMRTERKNYFICKYIATFVVGALSVVIPLAINFISCAMFLPAIPPDYSYEIYSGMYTLSMCSELFFTHPLIYCILFIVLTGIFAGLVANFSNMFSFLIKNRFAVIVLPFIIFLGINYVCETILYPFLSDIFVSRIFSPLVMFSGMAVGRGSVRAEVMIPELLILFAITFGVTIWRGIKNDVF